MKMVERKTSNAERREERGAKIDLLPVRAASFDYFRNRLIDANNRLLSINRINK